MGHGKIDVYTVSAGIFDDGLFNYKALPCSIWTTSEINKIKGHYAFDKKFNVNMSMEDMQEGGAREVIIKYTVNIDCSTLLKRFDYKTIGALLKLIWWDWPIEKIFKHFNDLAIGDPKLSS